MNRIGPRSFLCCVSALFGAAALCASSAHAFDVGIGEVHVTQAVQSLDPSGQLDLVADKDTAIRVQVERLSGTPGSVTGKLHAWINGVQVTPPEGLDDINRSYPAPHDAFVPPANPTGQLAQVLLHEEDTLNFEIPAADIPLAPPPGQLSTGDLYFQIVLDAPGDTIPGNDSIWTNNYTVVRRATPWIFKDQVFFMPGGAAWPIPPGVGPDPSFTVPGRGDAMISAVWPIPDAPTNSGSVTNPTYPPLLPGFYFTQDCDGDQKITSGSDCYGVSGNLIGDEQGLLLSKVNMRRQLLVDGGFGPDPLVYLYGYIQDGQTAGFDGVAWTGGNVGVGIDGANRGQQTAAHEFGHMVALPHNSPGRLVEEFGWDVGARLQNNPLDLRQEYLDLNGNTRHQAQSGRNRPRTWDGAAKFDEMMNNSGFTSTSNSWVDLENYQALLTLPKLADERLQGDDCDGHDPATTETLVVYGVPGESGTRVHASVWRYPWCTPSLAEPLNPNLTLTVTVVEPVEGQTETIVLPVDARMVADLSEGGHVESFGAFAVPVPVAAGTQLVSVAIDGDVKPQVLWSSEQAPLVQVLNPAPGALLGATVAIVWQGSDADEGDELEYQLAYSPNSGQDFRPVEVALTAETLTIDGTQLPATKPGQGLLRVFVNDGTRTSFKDVGGLSIKNAGPEVFDLIGPGQGKPGQPLAFRVLASDANGEALVHRWSFSDGYEEDTAQPRITHALPNAGDHWVQVVVIDGAGAAASASAPIAITSPGGGGSCGLVGLEGLLVALLLGVRAGRAGAR